VNVRLRVKFIAMHKVNEIVREIDSPFKLINIIDPHLSDRSPGYRCDDYTEAAWGKLDQIRVIAHKRKIDLLTLTGDLFSDRRKDKNSHKLTGSFIECLVKFDCEVASILGNHDLCYNRFDSWPEQPVSGLIKGGSLSLLDFGDFVYIFKDTGKKIRVRGRSYHEKSNIDHLYEPRGDEDLLIQVTHSSIDPKGGFYGKYSEEIHSYESVLDSSPDIFLLGHIHSPVGITELGGKHFFQHGSLMRSSTHDYNLERGINVGYLEISSDLKVKTEQIPLDIKPSHEIFDLEKKESLERAAQLKEEFFARIDEVRENRTKTISIESILEKVKDKDVERLRTIIEHYIDNVQ